MYDIIKLITKNMKKIIIGLFIAATLLPSLTFADTGNATLIALLEQLVQTLENEIAQIQASQTPIAPEITIATSTQDTTPLYGSIGVTQVAPQMVAQSTSTDATPQQTPKLYGSVQTTTCNPSLQNINTETRGDNMIDVSFTFSDGCSIPTGTNERWYITDLTGNRGSGFGSVNKTPMDFYSDAKSIDTSGLIGKFKSFETGTTTLYLQVNVGNETISSPLTTINL